MSQRFQLSAMVQKALTEKKLTADEVIRKALGLKSEGLATSEGVFFPEGTAFLAWYKERPHWAVIREGEITFEDGSHFASVSGAAAKVTGRPTTNGWDFWLIKVPGKNSFVPIADFRSETQRPKAA